MVSYRAAGLRGCFQANWRSIIRYLLLCSCPRRLGTQEISPQHSNIDKGFGGFEQYNIYLYSTGQFLSWEMPEYIGKGFPRWFRTLPKHGYPTEQIVRLTLQEQARTILAKCRPCLLLNKFIDQGG